MGCLLRHRFGGRPYFHLGNRQSYRLIKGMTAKGFNNQRKGVIRQFALPFAEGRIQPVIAKLKQDLKLLITLEFGCGFGNLKSACKYSVWVSDCDAKVQLAIATEIASNSDL